MRGYQYNRFVGEQYYLAQIESRFIALRWLSFVVHTGLGDAARIALSDFTRPKHVWGFGMRIGLPPNFVAKVRFEFALSPDEKNFYLAFNEAI